MEFDYITTERATNTKYINGYILGSSTVELHITDNSTIDHIILFDIEDFIKIRMYFWCVNFVGRKECEKPEVYTYAGKASRIYLNRLLMDRGRDERILFRNRDPYDFRKNNLVVNKITGIEERSCAKTGKTLPSNIFELRQKNGSLTGYRTIIRLNGTKEEKYFGLRKYKTLDNCLKMAIEELRKVKRYGEQRKS